MKKPVLLISFLILTIVVLSIVRIYVSNQISTSGMVLSQVQDKIDYYKTENLLIAQKVYEKSSLTTIASEAASLGFLDQNSEFVINGQEPVAYKQ